MGSTLCSLMPMVVLFLLMPCSSGDTQAINRICRQTDDYNFCRDVFNKHLFTPSPDVKELTQIAITQTLIYGSNTKIFISRSEAAEKNINMKNLYKICETSYGIVLDEFTSADLAFAKGDYRDMLFYIEKCDRFVSDCQSVLGGQVPQLSVQNLQNKVLIRMALTGGGLILIGQ